MNPEIQKELLSWLAGLREAVTTGVAFAKDQIPQVLWEKILVDRVILTLLIIVALATITSFFYYLPFRLKKIEDNEGYGKDESGATFAQYIIYIIVHGIAVIVAVISIGCNAYNLALVWFAPRLYLIQWITSLVQGQGK